MKNGQANGYCTLSPHVPLHLQSSVHCKFDARHFHWRLKPFLHPQCARSQHAVDPTVSSVQKGFHPESDVSHQQSAGLGRTGTGTSACDHPYPAWYAPRRICFSNSALVGGMFSIIREPCAKNSFHTPLAEHVLLYMVTRNLSILSAVS